MKKQKMQGVGRWLVVVWVIAAIVMGGCASAPSVNMSENAAPPPMAGSAAPTLGDTSEAQAPGSEGTAATNRMIIARASLTLVVADTQTTVDGIGTLMEEMEGYVTALARRPVAL
jgi:hypothetical protein